MPADDQLAMSFPDRRTSHIVLTILFLGGVCAVAYCARRILLLFVLAIFFAYLMNPVVTFLQRHSLLTRDLRGPAVVEVYLALVMVVAFAGYSFVPGLGRSAVKMVDGTPAFLNSMATGDIASDLRARYGWTGEQEFRLRNLLATHRADIQNLVPAADRYISNAVQVLGWLLVVPILAIFFLRDGDHIADMLIQFFFPARGRPRIRALANELHLMLTCYIRGQLILCGFSFLFYLTALLALQFPHAIALAILGGVLEFVPVVGWTSTFAIIVGTGIVNHSHWIWMAALLLTWRVVQDYVVFPQIMGQKLKIHPLGAIFAVLVGAELGGVIGIFLSIPVMASLRVICQGRAGEEIKTCLGDPAEAVSETSR
jgi:predicted PurR-regulated permease PerM